MILTAKRFSAGELKLLAMLSMLCDHAAYIFLRGPFRHAEFAIGIYYILCTVGRIAFPLYVFSLTEGFFHTRDRKKYALRLGLLALASEVPYNLLCSGRIFLPEKQNTIWLLLIGLLAMMALEKGAGKKNWLLIQGGVVIAGMLVSWLFRLEYGAPGFLLIMVMYRWRSRPDYRMMAGCTVIMAWCLDFFAIPTWFAFFFINRYNGEKGRDMGWFYELFYPVHLLLLAGILYAGIF